MSNGNTYQIVDVKTGSLVGKPYANRAAASRRADKLDQAYGAVRYTVRIIWADQKAAA